MRPRRPGQAQSLRSGDPYTIVVRAAPSSYWGYTYTPYASTLHGAAALLDAQGDYLINRLRAVIQKWIEETKGQGRTLEPEELAKNLGRTKPSSGYPLEEGPSKPKKP